MYTQQENNQTGTSGTISTVTIPSKQSWSLLVGFFVIGALLASILIYLTPLRDYKIVSPEIEKIDPAVFYDDYTKNPEKYYFVDVRPGFARTEYPEGAINKSIFGLSEEYVSIPRDKKIVLFCEEGVSAAVAAGFLKFEGFRDVQVIDGGRVKWKEAGLPITRNANYAEEAKGFLRYFEEGGLLPKKQ